MKATIMTEPSRPAGPGNGREPASRSKVPASKVQIHGRVTMLRRTAAAAAVLAFAGAWDLVAHHTVGVTARAQSSPALQSGGSLPVAPSQGSGGFFGSGNNAGSGSAGIGGGSGSGPVLGSSGS